MTNDQLDQIIAGLSVRDRRSITSARFDGVDYRLQTGRGRGLTDDGLAWRYMGATLLTETGLAIRSRLLEMNDE